MIRATSGGSLVWNRGRSRVDAFGGGIWGGGDAVFEILEILGCFGVETCEFGGDTGLYVQFQVFGAGAVGLWTGLEGIDEVLGEADGSVAWADQRRWI